MIDAGKVFREGFLKTFQTFGGTVIHYSDFNCSNSEEVELKGMKNHEKEDKSSVIFQFQINKTFRKVMCYSKKVAIPYGKSTRKRSVW